MDSMRLPQSILIATFVRKAHALTIAVVLLAGANAAAQQLTCSPPNLRFGAVATGQSETQVVSVTDTGSTSVTLTSIAVSGSEFSTSPVTLPLTLAAGQSVDLNVTFTASSQGWTGGTVRFYSNASNPTLALQMGGTSVTSQALSANPAVLSFGSVTTGSQSTLPVTITNTRSWSVIVAGIQNSGTEFSTSGATFPMTLAPGQSIAMNVTFAPQTAGEAGGSIFVYGPGLNIPLIGTGAAPATGQLVVAPSPLNFGNVTVGQSATELLTVTASGGSVTINSANSGNSQFALEGANFPITLNAGQSLTYDVAFAPQNTGLDSGSLTFSTNASNPVTTESLSGTGIAMTYTVNLSWNSTQNVTGYNIYRSTSASGSFAKVNTAVDPNTAYTDNTVASGQTYYYEATSINSAGQESARSTPAVQAVVP
jgi:Abnormal spindle-like microcephaly-assoc'd, ASPM-SPD-2-Hydin